ncbi:MAG: hypothetical protein IJY74_07255 [Oscillospiraceae bacterium]|nr:hypothetical protein [Oscillospiraceae bacterium]
MRRRSIFSSVLASLAALCMLPVMNASAATEADVINAVENAGWPDWMVQTVANSIAGGGFTSEQYDEMIGQVTEYDASIEKQIAEMWGIEIPEKETPTESTSGSTQGGAVSSGNSGASNGSGSGFADMTLEEKEEYISSMTEAEKQEFLANLSAEERNSIIKQMSISDKAELVAGFAGILESLGISVNIDLLTAENISISTFDKDGKLLGTSSMNMKVDPTGKPYTVPVVIGGSMLLTSAAGMAFLLRKKQWHEKETL